MKTFIHSTEFEDLNLAVSLIKLSYIIKHNLINCKVFALSEYENWHYRFSKIYISTGNFRFQNANFREKEMLKNINDSFLFNVLSYCVI